MTFVAGFSKWLAPFRRQAIIWIYADLFSIRFPRIDTINKIWITNLTNAFENIVCNMGAILYRPHCVDITLNSICLQQLVSLRVERVIRCYASHKYARKALTGYQRMIFQIYINICTINTIREIWQLVIWTGLNYVEHVMRIAMKSDLSLPARHCRVLWYLSIKIDIWEYSIHINTECMGEWHCPLYFLENFAVITNLHYIG